MNDGPANNSMERRNIYSELESGKGDGGHKSTGSKLQDILEDHEGGDGGQKSTGRKQQDTLEHHEGPENTWNCIFTISCAIAILIDPLYCYAPVIHTKKEGYCWKPDQALMWTYIALRLAVDVFYVIDLLGWWPGIHNKNILRDFWNRTSQKTALDSKWLKKELPSFLYFVLVSFPLPEGLLLSSICSGLLLYDWDPTDALIICTPFQYSLRIYHIYGTLRLRRPIFKTEIGKWLQAVMDYLPFILASHLFGALWYRLAVQRLVNCWKPNCDSFLKDCGSKRSRAFICGKEPTDFFKTENLSEWHRLCPVKEADPKVFDFGIYLYALQSNLTTSTNIVRRMPQSFWWALRNLSSFGSNLETSLYTEEIFLSVLISISGMALFLVYLNARVQVTKEAKNKLNESKSKRKTELLRPDIDLWLHKNGIKQAEIKTAIMKNIHKLGENKDINLQNILSVLPVNDKRNIIRLICLASLKKVPLLENIHKRVLVAICEHLKPVIYTEDSYIVKEGRPLGKILFIVEGLAWTYNPSNNVDVGTLNKGDFYGEEVLTWAFGSPSFSGSPISARTVVSQGKIEAFAIRTGDLKSVVYKFWWHFRENKDLSQLELWKHLAASSIQAAWRHPKGKAKLSNKWEFILSHLTAAIS